MAGQALGSVNQGFVSWDVSWVTVCPTLSGRFWFMLSVLSSLLISPFTVSSALRDHMVTLKMKTTVISYCCIKNDISSVYCSVWHIGPRDGTFIVSSNFLKLCSTWPSGLFGGVSLDRSLEPKSSFPFYILESLGFMLYFRNGINSYRVFRLSIRGRAHQINLPVSEAVMMSWKIEKEERWGTIYTEKSAV